MDRRIAAVPPPIVDVEPAKTRFFPRLRSLSLSLVHANPRVFPHTHFATRTSARHRRLAKDSLLIRLSLSLPSPPKNTRIFRALFLIGRARTIAQRIADHHREIIPSSLPLSPPPSVVAFLSRKVARSRPAPCLKSYQMHLDRAARRSPPPFFERETNGFIFIRTAGRVLR